MSIEYSQYPNSTFTYCNFVATEILYFFSWENWLVPLYLFRKFPYNDIRCMLRAGILVKMLTVGLANYCKISGSCIKSLIWMFESNKIVWSKLQHSRINEAQLRDFGVLAISRKHIARSVPECTWYSLEISTQGTSLIKWKSYYQHSFPLLSPILFLSSIEAQPRKG